MRKVPDSLDIRPLPLFSAYLTNLQHDDPTCRESAHLDGFLSDSNRTVRRVGRQVTTKSKAAWGEWEFLASQAACHNNNNTNSFFRSEALGFCGPRIHFARPSRSASRTLVEGFGLWLAYGKLKKVKWLHYCRADGETKIVSESPEDFTSWQDQARAVEKKRQQMK